MDNESITAPLPPETSTPMPPQLATVYDKALGWPGPWADRPRDDLGYIPLRHA